MAISILIRYVNLSVVNGTDIKNHFSTYDSTDGSVAECDLTVVVVAKVQSGSTSMLII